MCAARTPPAGMLGEALGFELREREQIRAVFRPDLDARLDYGEGLVVLTNERLAYKSAAADFQFIDLTPELELVQGEHAGVGEIMVSEVGRERARFRHTLAEARAASDLVDLFEAARATSSPRARRRRLDSEEDEDEPAPSPIAAGRPLLRLLAFARPHLPRVLLGFGLTLASTLAGLIPPYLTMPLVDEVLVPGQALRAPGGAELGRVALYLGGLGLSAVLAWLLAWGQGAVLANVTERISADLRNRTFAHLQRLSLEYFGGKRTGDLIARIGSDTDNLCSFLSDTLIDFITDVLMIVATSVVLFTLDPLLASAALVSFPPIAWLIVRVRGTLTHGFLRGGRVWSAMTNILADTIPGIRVVKAFSQERREIRRFARANERIVEVNNKNNALWTFFWPLVLLLNQLGLLVVWAVGAWEVLHHQITVGVLTAFIAYIGRFYTRVESMSRMLTATQKASAGAQRLFEILDRVPSVTEPKNPIALGEVRGQLDFSRVLFRYGSRLVLDDVSFRVEPGKMVGIVGHTGSGKSTVANLLCRFYDVSSGAVLVDGVDVRRLAIEEYRRNIGIVLQDPFLFFGTIAENVAYGEPEAPRERVLKAARAARAHDFILKLPEGYDSLVGERGQSLSGGERQRIAIARAILVDPKILILDEATSAVDVETEREIQRALDDVVTGRTTVAIAHRLSTLAKADFLVVLRDGKVVETGTRSELLARDGEYARLERAQARSSAAHVDTAPDTQAPSEAPSEAPQVPRFDEGQFALTWTPDRGLLLRDAASGTELVVRSRRCFPLSDPAHFTALVDAAGRERACIADAAALSEPSRAALLASLEAHEFLPRIERIERVEHDATRSEWFVVTDRGAWSFVVEQEDHIRPLDDGRHLITDSHGMRYLVPRAESLDAGSRRWLGRFA